jgi:serine/threonine protein kinase
MNQDPDPTVDLNMHSPKEPRSSPSGLSVAPTPGLIPGQLVNDRFKILEQLGKGAMGTVYRVEQVFIKKQFALKVLNGVAVSGNTMRRFQNEAEAAARLEHPNLAKAIDFGLINGQQPFIVLDLVQGETLAHHLKNQGKLDWQKALRIFVQVFDAMAHAHDQGVIHRDIKPSNIVLTPSLDDPQSVVPKVVDFGIAKLELDNDTEGSPLTKTGEVFGTPLYMSPEQCSGTRVDNRSDIYSLGCVLFETLTGCPPFTADTALETMMLHKISDAPELKEASLGLSFPPALDSVIRKLLAKERENRYQNCREAASDLNAVLQNKMPAAPGKMMTRNQLAKTRGSVVAIQAPMTIPLTVALVGLTTILLLATSVLIIFNIAHSAGHQNGARQQASQTPATGAAAETPQSPAVTDAAQSMPSLSSSSDQQGASDYSDGAMMEQSMTAGKTMLQQYLAGLTDRCAFPIKQFRLLVSDLKPLKSHTSLTYVNVSDHTELQGDDVIQCLPAENLQTLLIRNTNLTNRGVKQIGERLSQLGCLDISTNDGITDLRPLGQLRLLTELRVQQIGSLRHAWMGTQKPSLGGLLILNAAYGAMDDASLPYLESLHSLRRLTIAGNSEVTDKSGSTLAKCTSLRDLDIGDMNVSDNMLDKIQHLKLIRLSLRNTKVTKGGVVKLLKHMPTLKYLILDRTLNQEDLADLRRQFPNCEIPN